MTPTRKRYSHGVQAVLLASMLWGTTGVATSFAPGVNALTLASASWGIGGSILALMSLQSIIKRRVALAAQWRWLLLGAGAAAIYPIAFYESMRLAGVTVGTVVTISSAPLFSVLLEVAVDKSRLSLRWLLSAVIGISGIVLLCIGHQSKEIHGALHSVMPYANTVGVLLGLFAGLAYALYSWIGHRLIQHGASSRSAMGAIIGLGGMCLIPVLLLTGGVFLDHWESMAVGVYLVVVPIFLGYVCFGFGLARIKASMATTISLLEPVVAAVLAAVIVGERLSTIGWLGMTLIFICLACSTLPLGRKHEEIALSA